MPKNSALASLCSSQAYWSSRHAALGRLLCQMHKNATKTGRLTLFHRTVRFDVRREPEHIEFISVCESYNVACIIHPGLMKSDQD